MPSPVKPALRFVARFVLRVMPTRLTAELVRRRPRLAGHVPPGRELLFRGYLGDLSVRIDPVYPIERGMLTGRYDPTTLAVLERFVRPGDVCLDVGANVGAVTLALAKRVGPAGRVLAFEPGGFTFRRLTDNLALNPRFNGVVLPYRLGLSDTDGVLTWAEDANNRGNAGFLGVAEGCGEAVPVVTLDGLFARETPGRVDFVKIDVEGMELEVIRGGARTWANYRPVLYYETLLNFEAQRGRPLFRPVEELLGALGYTFYRVGPGGSIRPTRYPNLSDNTLALPSGR